MKIRTRNISGRKIDTQMTPMIDVVFQLLIFFMCTFKIIEPEGDFNINMPLGKPAEATVSDAELPPLRVRLIADPETGDLQQLLYNDREFGNGPEAFSRLNQEVGSVVAALNQIGPADAEEGDHTQEVELDPDFDLDYRHVISAISACSGSRVNGVTVPYINRIRFAQIRDER